MDGNNNETSISFVLGDEQKEDEFTVDIYIDPIYGTFVFQHNWRSIEGSMGRSTHHTRRVLGFENDQAFTPCDAR